MTRLRSERDGSGSFNRLGESSKHHKVTVKADALQATSPERGVSHLEGNRAPARQASAKEIFTPGKNLAV
jgi:hypothetical protein